MGLLFLEGFDHYNTEDLEYKWYLGRDNTPIHSKRTCRITDSFGTRTGLGKYLHIFATNYDFHAYQFTKRSSNTMIVGMALKIVTDSNCFALEFLKENSTTSYARFEFRYDGSLGKHEIKVITNGGNFYTGKIILPDIWTYFEFKVVSHPNVGSVEIRMENTSILLEENINTVNGETIASKIGGLHVCSYDYYHNNVDIHIDDLYILDNYGTENTDFLGDISVYTIKPNAIGSSSSLTPSSGDNYACISSDNFQRPFSWADHLCFTELRYANDYTTVDQDSSYDEYVRSNYAITPGKWYWEITLASSPDTTTEIGIVDVNGSCAGEFTDEPGYSIKALTGEKNSPFGLEPYGNPVVLNDVIGVAFDALGKIWFSINGIWQNGGDPVTAVSPAYSTIISGVYCAAVRLGDNRKIRANFGDDLFKFEVPTGFLPVTQVYDYKSVSTTDINVTESYGFTDIPTNVLVKGVAICTYSRKTTAGVRKLESLVNINGTEYTTGHNNIANGISLFQDIFDKSPDTSTSWTCDEVNQSEFGISIKEA